MNIAGFLFGDAERFFDRGEGKRCSYLVQAVHFTRCSQHDLYKRSAANSWCTELDMQTIPLAVTA